MSPVTAKEILIVDDDRDLQQLLTKRLENEGFACQSALSVEEGLAKVRESCPDLIILDLGFPNADGTAFLKSARSCLPAGKGIPPVIVLTCYNDVEVRDYLIDQGASGFVPKPYDPKDLVSLIRDFLP